MKRGGIFLAARMALGLMAALAVSACAQGDDGSTVTLAIPKLPPKAMLEKLDLNVPTDLSIPDGVAGAQPALAAAPAFNAATGMQSPDDAARALDCLTQAVYYEAGNQSDDGQRAVAQVVLNRVRDRAFPSSVCGVVYQGSTRSTGCQFTFTCDGSLNRTPTAAGWARARAVASSALNGAVYAPVGSATFYHANYVSPWWANSMDKVATVGAHIFYRWRGGMESALAFKQPYSGSEPTVTGRTGGGGGGDMNDPGVETVAGVQIYRGIVTPSAPGATIAPTKPGTTTTAAATKPAPAPTSNAKLIRVGGGSGVRVYRGATGSAASGEDLSDQATVD